jgi:hypothetical protein
MCVRSAFVVAIRLLAVGDLTESLRRDCPRGVPCGGASGLRNAGRAAPATVLYAVTWMKQ